MLLRALQSAHTHRGSIGASAHKSLKCSALAAATCDPGVTMGCRPAVSVCVRLSCTCICLLDQLEKGHAGCRDSRTTLWLPIQTLQISCMRAVMVGMPLRRLYELLRRSPNSTRHSSCILSNGSSVIKQGRGTRAPAVPVPGQGLREDLGFSEP